MLPPEAVWALLETPSFAQLSAQLFLVGLLHGFDGWKQGREVEGNVGGGQWHQDPPPSGHHMYHTARSREREKGDGPGCHKAGGFQEAA